MRYCAPLYQRKLAVLLVLCLCISLGVNTGEVAAQDGVQGSDEVQPEATSSLFEVDGATIDEVQEHLETLQQEYDDANKALAEAEEVSAKAKEELAEAEEKVKEAEELVEFWDETAKEAVIGAFVSGNEVMGASIVMGDDIYDASARTTFSKHEADRTSEILETQLNSHEYLEEVLDEQTEQVEKALEAEDHARTQVAKIDTAVADQITLVAQVESRYERALAESAALATQFDQTSEELATSEQELYETVSAAPLGPPAPQNPGGSTPVSQGNSPVTTAKPQSPAPSNPTATVPVLPAVATSWVQGIQVATSIKSSTTSMLNAASNAGLSLSGSGYRDSARQVELRRANCGPSNYEIYEMSASQCRPPTAIPGRSMHEKGLALDLTCSGTLIRSQNNPCFVWLRSNASKYGFYNLPSEPWHWSTNGN